MNVSKYVATKTKAIVPVHFTNMTNMLIEKFQKFGIKIIEDACQSILGEINKKKVVHGVN